MFKKRISKFDQKTNGILNFSDLHYVRFKILYWFLFAFMLAIALICFLPIVWVFLSGFKSVKEMYAVPPTLFPKSIDLSIIKEVWNKVDMTKYVMNSLIQIVGCWVAGIFVPAFAAFSISRIKPIGSKVIDKAIFITMLLPGATMVANYMLFAELDLIGSAIPLYLMAGTNAMNILYFKVFFNGIPMTYLEAARIDGCSDLRAFFSIIFPLSKPIIVVLSIYSIVGTWGNFMNPYLYLSNTDLEPVSVMLYKIGNSALLMENEYLVLLMLSILPMMIVYAIFSKHISGGLNMSGLKG